MIPKTIHYCWFGGKPKPKLAEKCIASWRRLCPDFEIIEWNESNYDVTAHPYTKSCFERGMWAFLSDFVRLDVVFREGGLYFDTDVELIRDPSQLLENEAFFAFESSDYVNTGLGFGSVAGHPAVSAMLAEYARFDGTGADFKPIGCPTLNTAALEKLGLEKNGKEQLVGDVLVLPTDRMNPLDDVIGRLAVTDSTISIHWCAKSALRRSDRIRSRLTRPLHRLFGKDFFTSKRRKKK